MLVIAIDDLNLKVGGNTRGTNWTIEMRLIVFYISQTLLGVAFYNLTYLPTLRLDLFEWGNSNNDGLYLLFVPFVLLPTILVISTIKYFVTRKLDLETFYKWSFIISIASSLICTLLVFADVLWPTVIISLLTTMFIVIETIILSRQFLTNKIDVKT